MNIILNSLKQSFTAIKKNKLFFLILIIGEIIFLSLSSMIFIHFSSKIFENAQPIFEPLQDMEQDSPLDLSTIYEDPVEVLAAYSSLKLNIFLFFGSLLLIYLAIKSLSWGIACLIAQKNDFMFYPLKFILLTLIFLVPSSLVIWLFTKISIDYNILKPYVYPLLASLIIIAYFLKISYTLAGKYNINQIFKKTLKKTFIFGVKKIKIYIPAFMLSCGSNALALFLIYKAAYGHILLLIASIILFLLTLSWSKVYLMIITRNLTV